MDTCWSLSRPVGAGMTGRWKGFFDNTALLSSEDSMMYYYGLVMENTKHYNAEVCLQ
jgi:hypothetical protein